MEEEKDRTPLSRRSFVKYAAIGGLAAVGAYSGIVYPSGWQRWLEYGQKPWETAPGVVDYRILKEVSWGPSELGFENDIRNSPPEARVLSVAQWYDYWPGIVITNFGTYMQNKWDLSGVRVEWTSNIYTSNEELFTWVTQTGRKFDVMYPSSYTVETFEKAGLIVNMNRDWIPNYLNLFGRVPDPIPNPRDEAHATPWLPPLPAQETYPVYPNGYNNAAGFDFRDAAAVPHAYRGNTTLYPAQKAHPEGKEWTEQNGLLAVPFQWGTTGIGYRSDIFDKADIERLGWEVFELATYTNPKTGRTYDLTNKKMMLDDMREVFTAGLKRVGWKEQERLGRVDPVTGEPTGITHNPASPWNGVYQLSGNEIGSERLRESSDWLLSIRDTLWGFNTPQQGPWLVSGERWVDQAWSGDIMYAVRPNSNQHLPVDYFIPKEGGARWIDGQVIHRESEKLWLAHEFVDYIQDPQVQATISSWNLYATGNAWAFELLEKDPAYTFTGIYPDGSPYTWAASQDSRIYSDFASGYQGSPILERAEYQHDVGVRNTLKYFDHWRQIKF